jgi:hypothetical protein
MYRICGLRTAAFKLQGQGDQIGRIFACWVTCFLWVVFVKITKVAQYLGYIFQGKRYEEIFKNMYWATFWATISQMLLVTLFKVHVHETGSQSYDFGTYAGAVAG